MAVIDRSCHCCKEERHDARMPPRKLVELPTTARNGVAVYACEHCDGPVVRLAARKGK